MTEKPNVSFYRAVRPVGIPHSVVCPDQACGAYMLGPYVRIRVPSLVSFAGLAFGMLDGS